MDKNKNIKSIKADVDNLSTYNVLYTIQNKKLKKDLLVAYLRQDKHLIYVYDAEKAAKEIARIRYSFGDMGVFIRELFVEEQYQQNGIAKLLLDIAMIHGDSQGLSMLYGFASPTAKIKGVSEGHNDLGSANEQMALTEIYTRMGCTFDAQLNDIDDDYKFVKRWKPGVEYYLADKKIKMLVKKINEKEEELSKNFT